MPGGAGDVGPVVLRPLTLADVPMVVELGQDPYVPTIGSIPAGATAEQAADWIDRQRQRRVDGVGWSFAVADGDDRAVGTVSLSLVPGTEDRAAAGYAVPRSARHRGVATRGLRALTEFAWRLPALHRVELHVETWNHASCTVAERAGYQREGLLRSHQVIDGWRRDVLLYAAVRDTPGLATSRDDGAGRTPVVVVVEHLADRSYRLWLDQPRTRADLGRVTGTRQLGSVARRRAAAHLGLDEDRVSLGGGLITPVPGYGRTRGPVLVTMADGRELPAYVLGYAQGGFHLDTPEGVGIHPPETIDFDPPLPRIT